MHKDCLIDMCVFICFYNDTATTEIYTNRHTLSLHDALPILLRGEPVAGLGDGEALFIVGRLDRQVAFAVEAHRPVVEIGRAATQLDVVDDHHLRTHHHPPPLAAAQAIRGQQPEPNAAVARMPAAPKPPPPPPHPHRPPPPPGPR